MFSFDGTVSENGAESTPRADACSVHVEAALMPSVAAKIP
jgi:hypothetical protein